MVSFDDVEEFLEELAAECKANPELKQLVRLTDSSAEINNGVSRVLMKAGFETGGQLRELSVDCGEDWKGGKQEGTDTKNRIAALILEACKQLNCEVRGGQFRG